MPLTSTVRYVNALLASGDEALDEGRPEEALTRFREAAAHAPSAPIVLSRLGRVLCDLGRYADAVDAFLGAVRGRPDESRYWHNLAIALRGANRQAEARKAWEKAVELAPEYVPPKLELARLFEAEARLWRADSLYRAILACAPDHLEATLGLSQVRMHLGEPGDALRLLGRALRLAPEARRRRIHSAFLLTAHYHPRIRAPGLAALARRAPVYHELEPEPGPSASRPGRNGLRERPADSTSMTPGADATAEVYAERAADARISIGYVSPRLGDTPPGRMLREVLGAHDRTRFRIVAYSTHRYADRVAMELASRVDAWRDAAGEDAHGLANRIRDDRIDILVDLAGHAPGGRTDVLSLRPARVQLTWLDYFDTMGLSCYDGIVSDGVSTPPGSEVFYAERVLRLPHCRFVFAPAADRPAPGPLPASARGTLTFGSFNRLAKVNRSVIAAWAAILHALPGSRLVLKSTSFDAPDEHAEHRARLAALGLPVDRVTLLPSSNSAGLWRDYQAIDVALDTFPFNGGITTFDALSMGVPVLAVRGDSMVSRQSASLLSAVGLEDWIADDVDGYVRLALRWAERVAELAALRASLPARVRASPLCDAPAFTRALEECYDAALSGLPARTGRA